jgi:signal transduction histidine kinase
MMAHELRAPLTAIKGYSELLAESLLEQPVLIQHVTRISQSSERLIEMISDLLDVSRIQSGSLSINFERSDVSGVVQAVLQELQVTAQEKNITLHSVGADSPHEAEVDVVRLHQVLTNLVNNSIKYTESGSIEVQVTPRRRDVEIRIKDTGMGINADDQKKLFAPFFRVRTADVSAITGSGLGMWITKQLVTMMGGTIGVESIRGVGTHIVLTFRTTRTPRLPDESAT